jgi:hypothetical protein
MIKSQTIISTSVKNNPVGNKSIYSYNILDFTEIIGYN